MSAVIEGRDQGFPENIEFGCPQDWSYLIQPPTEGALTAVSSLFMEEREEKRQEYLERLAKGQLGFLAQFFSACPELVFFFIAWDRTNYRVVQRAGPTRKKVRSLLQRRQRRKTNSSQSEVCDRVYDAVQTVLDALDRREKFSYVLLWQLPDDPLPHLETSLDTSGHQGWTSIRQSLPREEWDRIPATPPPSEIDFERTAINPAPPTVLEPDPATCNIVWHDYQRHLPMRLPDWRWNRAFAAVRHGRYFSRQRDDEVTGQAIHFLREVVKRPQDTESIKREYPDLVAAHAIRTGPPDFRLELEARVLARQSPQEIAKRLAITPAALNSYIDCFFDIRDRLESKMYIQKQVLQPAWWSHAAEGLLMFVAYHGGPVILDAVIPLLRENGRELQRLTAGESIQCPLSARLDLLLQARLLPDDEKTRKDLIRRFYDLLETFPKFEPKLNLIGSFSQIVGPFKGELDLVAVSDAGSVVEINQAA